MGKKRIAVPPNGGLADVLLALRQVAQGEHVLVEISAVAAKVLDDHITALTVDNNKAVKAVLGGVKPKDHYLVHTESWDFSPKKKLLTVVLRDVQYDDWREGDTLWDTANRDVSSREKWRLIKCLTVQRVSGLTVATWKVRPEGNV